MKKYTILFLFLLTPFLGSSIIESFSVVKIDLAKSNQAIGYFSRALAIPREDIIIARTVRAEHMRVSVQDPIETYGYSFSLSIKPDRDLLALYREMRNLTREENLKDIPRIVVLNKKTIISKMSLETKKPNQEINDLLQKFTNLEKLKSDLFSSGNFSERIVLAENTNRYSARGKPFSKYISKGVPGLKSLSKINAPKKVKQPELIITSPMRSIEPRLMLSTKKSKKRAVTSHLNSQRLLSAIKKINKITPEKKFENKVKQEMPLVIDVNQALAKSSKQKKKKNNLFGELKLKDENRCIQTHSFKKNSKTYHSTLRIAADTFHVNGGFQTDVADFNLDFSDSYNDLYYDQTGIITLEQNIASEFGIRRATLQKAYHYPTVSDLVFERDDLTINIPMVSIESMSTLFKSYPDMQHDAHALIELDDKTENANLIGVGSQYIHKIYLNANFKIVKPGNSDYSYILFINVKPGNYFLEYELQNGKKTNKIIHVESEKIYFESNYFVKEKKDQFAIYENDLLTKCAYEVDLKNENLISIAEQKHSTKLNTNNYKFNKITYPLGTRKYYEIKYDQMSLFIGRQSSKQVIIPSKDYIDYLYDQFNINSLEGMCLIQLNLNKPVENVKINMTSPNYGFDYDLLVLDSDGLFYEDFTANTSRVFILGSEQGIANIKMEYLDGSFDYLQSYCSDSTYLVEEL